jgi:hypothetical protein
MAQRLRSRAAAAVAAGLAATCIGVAAGPAFADTVRNQEWWLASLHVTKAWLSSRGTGIKVAVLDTGVDPTQPDLAGSVITGRDYTASGRTAGGPFWGAHGTAVASIIAGHGHGPHHADGIIGVAPQARILSVRVTLENKDPLLANSTVATALPQAIARGIGYAVRHGAQVIELPLDPAAQAGATTPGGSPAERAAVEAALRKGVVLVAPSGDNGAGSDTVNYPAAYPGVISVGAFSQGFVKAPFTNHQPYATLTAAGNGVVAANGPTGYAKLKSTSAASAVVAGIAALIRSQFPTFTPAQVELALTSSTAFHHPGGHKDGSGFGTADAAAALLAAAKINATPASSASAGTAGNPTPPAAPAVKVHTKSLWQAVRIPVLGLAALILLALIILITVRVRQRRALDAQLAPLQAAALASRAQAMAGMGSPGPGYGPPVGARVAGRAPASSEPAGSGPANFGLGSGDLAGPGLAGAGVAGPGSSGPGLAGPGLAGTGSAALTPGGNGFTGGGGAAGGGPGGPGRPGSGPVGRPVVSGKPPWEEEEEHPLSPKRTPVPPAPEPGRPGSRFMLPGRGLGGMDAAGRRPAAGGGPGIGGPAGSSSGGTSAPGREGRSALNLGGWSLGKSGGGGGPAGARNGAADADDSAAGPGTTSNGATGTGTTGTGTTGTGTAGNRSPGRDSTGGSGTSGSSTGGSSTGTGSTGSGFPGPLSGIGGTGGSNGAAAAARARFGPSPFDDPSFEIPAFSPPSSSGSPLDDRAFGAPSPGTAGAPPSSAAATGAPGESGRLAPPAGSAGSRGPGRHGVARGAAGANSPGAGGADSGSPAAGRPGDLPAPPMRTLGSAHRLNAVRAPGTSGHPPWEPAEKPVSELPWMDAPDSGQSRTVPPRRVFPVGGEGPAAGAAAGGPGAGGTGTGRPLAASRPADPGPPPMTESGLVRRRPKSQSPFPDLDGPPPGPGESSGSGGGEDVKDTSRPMYSWNPSDTTEAFPKVLPPGDSHPG